MVTSDFRPEVEIRPFRACAMNNTQYNAHLSQNRLNSRILKEIGVEEHDGDSDFRPEVEIRQFCACAMKNTQYNAYLWPNRRNSRVIKEIGVEEHDGDVRF